MKPRDDLPSLLLLPFPPDPAGRQTLNAAYRPPLKAAISQVRNPARQSKLVVAVTCSVLHGPYMRSKTFSWPETQSLIAGLYTLISVICAQLSIPTEYDGGPGSVETTVVLLDHDRKRTFRDGPAKIEVNNTIIVDLATFASAYHPWNYIFHEEGEVGVQLSQDFLKLAEHSQKLLQEQLVTVDGGLTLNIAKKSPPPGVPVETGGYPVVCLGGTFDHLHAGHKLLLTAGALLLRVPREEDEQQPCRYIIGITGDELLKDKKYADQVQSWNDRAESVILFLATLLALSLGGWKDIKSPEIVKKDGDLRASFRKGTIEVQCVRIEDPFGPTITLPEIDVLVVSGETRSGGKAVNDKRLEQGFKKLEIFEVDVLDAEDISDETAKTENYAAKISSTTIRKQRAEARNNTLKI